MSDRPLFKSGLYRFFNRASRMQGKRVVRELFSRLRCLNILIFLFVSLPGSELLFGEVFWSPNAQWLAFRQELSSATTQNFSPGWLFDPSQFLGVSLRGSATDTESNIIWIGRSDLNLWHKVSSSRLILSDPAWSPEGNALYFAGAEKVGDGKLFWRVRRIRELSSTSTQPGEVIWEAKLPPNWTPPEHGSRKRVILTQFQAGPEGLLIFADPTHDELVLYQSSSNEVLTRFPDGHNAQINRSGDMVAWLRSDQWPTSASELVLTRVTDLQNTQQLANVLPDSRPVFSNDGLALYVGRHEKPPEGVSVPPGSDWPDIARVDLKLSRAQRFSRPVLTPILPSEKLISLAFALNPEEDVLFCAPAIAPRPAEISWFQPKTAATYKRFPPLDLSTNAVNITLSSDQRMALRLGQPDYLVETAGLPAALCDPRSEQLLPLVPDEQSSRIWVRLLARSAARIFAQELEPNELTNVSRRFNRFSLIPIPGELPVDGPPTIRLRRIGVVGLRALGFDPKAPTLEHFDRLADWQIEAAALFLSLTNHHTESLKALKRIPVERLSFQGRSRLLAVIAQESIAVGEYDEANMIIESLQTNENQNVGTIEPDGIGGWRLVPQPKSPWQELLQKLGALSVNPPRSVQDVNPNNPFGHFNPDDPANDPDLRMQAPLPQAP